jgi:hypothetical protein
MSEKLYPMKDIDRLVDILYRLRGQIGAVYYLMNPEGTWREPPVQHIETWLSDIGDKLDEAIEIL